MNQQRLLKRKTDRIIINKRQGSEVTDLFCLLIGCCEEVCCDWLEELSVIMLGVLSVGHWVTLLSSSLLYWTLVDSELQLQYRSGFSLGLVPPCSWFVLV